MTDKDTSFLEKIGTAVPDEVNDAPEVDLSVTEGWQSIAGLSSTISDILDGLGYALAVPATYVPARVSGKTIVGRAITVKYLPSRRTYKDSTDGLVHKSAMNLASARDVLVIEGDKAGRFSAFGGLAAHTAKGIGIAGLVVDGAVRDIQEIEEMGIPVWSSGITALSGQKRLQGIGINVPICVYDVQVRPGDIVVADDGGICFVPAEILPEVDKRLRELTALEQQIMGN